MLRRLTLLGLILCTPLMVVYAQTFKAFNGRVFDAQTKRGIENLEVKLRPPTASSAPILIGNTDENGIFHFSQVKPGRYLLDVSQGPYLLYRAEIDAAQTSSVDIPIERR